MEFHTRWRLGPDERMLCVVNGSHLFPAWCSGAVDGGTSLRCYQGCCDGAVSRRIAMNDVIGVDAGADAGAGGDTCSCHLAVPCCTLRTPPDRARVSSELERVGYIWVQLERRDVQGIDMTKRLNGL
jgi:hypothetical protein